MSTRNKPTPEQIQGMIFQAYEQVPHADARRLAAIEARVRPSKAISCQRRTQAPWWMIGLVLVASGAAAWWATHNEAEQKSIGQTEALTKSLPAVSPQAVDAISLHQSLPSDAHENAVSESADSDHHLSQSTTDKAESVPKSPRIIFQREVF